MSESSTLQGQVDALRARRVDLERLRDDATTRRAKLYPRVAPAIAENREPPRAWTEVNDEIARLGKQIEAVDTQLMDLEPQAAAAAARAKAERDAAEDAEVAELLPSLIEQKRLAGEAWLAADEVLTRFAETHPRRIDRGFVPEVSFPYRDAITDHLARIDRVAVAVLSPAHSNGLIWCCRRPVPSRRLKEKEERARAQATAALCAAFGISDLSLYQIDEPLTLTSPLAEIAKPLFQLGILKKIDPPTATPPRLAAVDVPVRFTKWDRGYQVGELAWFSESEAARLEKVGVAVRALVEASPAAAPAELEPIVLLVDGVMTGNVRGDLCFVPAERATALIATKLARKPTSAELQAGRQVALGEPEPAAPSGRRPPFDDWGAYTMPRGEVGTEVRVLTPFGVWRRDEHAWFGSDVLQWLIDHDLAVVVPPKEG